MFKIARKFHFSETKVSSNTREVLNAEEWERGGCQISFEILLVEGNNNKDSEKVA